MRFLVLLMLVSVSLSSQDLKYSDLGKIQKVNKKNRYYSSYESSRGELFKIGDTLRVGKASGQNGQYVFVYQAGGNIITGVTSRLAGQEISGGYLIVSEITLVGKKSTGFSAHIKFEGGNALGDYYSYFENAIEAGELKGNVMSSDEALAALKRAKDKLDLGLISQEEYDKLKKRLSKLIG